MASNDPRVSVIMPVYNGEKYLRESVQSILAQTFMDFEFIIVDDGSADDTPGILRSYHDERIQLLQNGRNCGVSISLNRGIAVAKGAYIARMDCDDVSLPGRLAAQVQFLDENPTVGIIGSWYEVISQDGQLTGKIQAYLDSAMGLRWVTLFSNPVAHPTIMARRQIFSIAGQYDSAEEPAEDYGLWARINMSTRFSNLPKVFLYYRMHDHSISGSPSACQEKMACRISQKSILSYTGENFPIENIELIRKPNQVFSRNVYHDSIRLLCRLYRKFRKENKLDHLESVDVELDLANKLTRISNMNRQFLSSRLFRLYAMIIVNHALLLRLMVKSHPGQE